MPKESRYRYECLKNMLFGQYCQQHKPESNGRLSEKARRPICGRFFCPPFVKYLRSTGKHQRYLEKAFLGSREQEPAAVIFMPEVK